MADSLRTLRCPACGQEMKKIYIPEQKINIDICIDGCGGIFFDNRELEKFDEPHEKIDSILEAISGKTFEKVDEMPTRICPCCGHNMTKTGAADGTIQIDFCYTCGGKFLDNGELLKIRNHSDSSYSENVDILFDTVYKEEMHQMFGNYASNKNSARRQFFEDVVTRLIT